MHKVIPENSSPTPGSSEGLAFDLAAMERLAFGRRRALGLFGLGAGALLTGCGGGDSDTSATPASGATATATPTPTATATPTPTATATADSCVSYASETNGPYPADGTNTSRGTTSNVLTISGIERQDIRSSFIGSTTAVQGVPTALEITLVDVNNGCAPLAGYAIYLWHCNATGQYSLYDVPAESWLRGLQVTDASGKVSFTTIWPGCYPGRFPHIHFEVFSSLANATGGRYAKLISQFAMPDEANRAVYALSNYGSSASNYGQVSIASDNVFGDNASTQMQAMTLSASGSTSAGYTATATVGIAT